MIAMGTVQTVATQNVRSTMIGLITKKGKRMTVSILKYPSTADWMLCKKCALNTVGKVSMNLPTDEWKKKILEAEHSPIRTLEFCFRMEIPYWVSVHFVRHKFGVEHFVQSQRDDRAVNTIPRKDKPQGEMVSHIMYINAQELINMSHRRLCKQASPETRYVMNEIVRLVVEKCPEFEDVLVPMCVYRNGKCTEFNSCKKGS